MALEDVIAQIDAEIARLQLAKSLLAASDASSVLPAVRTGRPSKHAEAPTQPPPAKKKRNLSPEGRARIAEAVKRRWTLHKGNQKGKA